MIDKVKQVNYIHPSACVEDQVELGENVYVWHGAHIRSGAKIGNNCIIGKDVYIDTDVIISDDCKIQNGAYIYYKAYLQKGVFIGPGVIIANDKYPRAINKEGKLKSKDDWVMDEVFIKQGASIGAGSIVLPGVTIGEYAMVGAGSVVVEHVLSHRLVYGNPAVHKDFVCKCGRPLMLDFSGGVYICNSCGYVLDKLIVE